jgi:thiamine biosynthesis lipoprotein
MIRHTLQLQLCLMCTLLISPVVHAQWLSESRDMMGTVISVELWATNEEAGNEAIERVMAEVHRLDVMMNPWNSASELSRINREADSAPVTTTPEIVEVVAQALYYSRLSDGAFDISFASVGQYYDYRAGTAPPDAQVQRELDKIDYRAIVLNAEAGTIAFTRPGLQIDLGGIAKGYAVDRGIAILQQAGITSAVISAGGDTRVLGDLGDRPRTIGIRHPRKKEEFAAVIPLADTAISTSGDYERFFEKNGVRFHHILDPGTGRSASSVQSASILAPRAVDSDALSTTVFVLGVQSGLALVNRLPGVDAIIIDGAGKLHYSAELLLNTTP